MVTEWIPVSRPAGDGVGEAVVGRASLESMSGRLVLAVMMCGVPSMVMTTWTGVELLAALKAHPEIVLLLRTWTRPVGGAMVMTAVLIRVWAAVIGSMTSTVTEWAPVARPGVSKVKPWLMVPSFLKRSGRSSSAVMVVGTPSMVMTTSTGVAVGGAEGPPGDLRGVDDFDGAGGGGGRGGDGGRGMGGDIAEKGVRGEEDAFFESF